MADTTDDNAVDSKDDKSVDPKHDKLVDSKNDNPGDPKDFKSVDPRDDKRLDSKDGKAEDPKDEYPVDTKDDKRLDATYDYSVDPNDDKHDYPFRSSHCTATDDIPDDIFRQLCVGFYRLRPLIEGQTVIPMLLDLLGKGVIRKDEFECLRHRATIDEWAAWNALFLSLIQKGKEACTAFEQALRRIGYYYIANHLDRLVSDYGKTASLETTPTDDSNAVQFRHSTEAGDMCAASADLSPEIDIIIEKAQIVHVSPRGELEIKMEDQLLLYRIDYLDRRPLVKQDRTMEETRTVIAQRISELEEKDVVEELEVMRQEEKNGNMILDPDWIQVATEEEDEEDLKKQKLTKLNQDTEKEKTDLQALNRNLEEYTKKELIQELKRLGERLQQIVNECDELHEEEKKEFDKTLEELSATQKHTKMRTTSLENTIMNMRSKLYVSEVTMKRENDEKVRAEREATSSYVLQLEMRSIKLLLQILRSIKDEKLRDVVLELYRDYRLRIRGIDSSLTFLLDSSSESTWVLNHRQEIQQVLDTLFPGGHQERATWTELLYCGSYIDRSQLVVGRPMPDQVYHPLRAWKLGANRSDIYCSMCSKLSVYCPASTDRRRQRAHGLPENPTCNLS